MSTVTVSLGRARKSSQVQVFRSSPSTIANVHSSSGVWGVGPAERTGKSSVTYWPGGTRLASASDSGTGYRESEPIGALGPAQEVPFQRQRRRRHALFRRCVVTGAPTRAQGRLNLPICSEFGLRQLWGT